MPRHATPERAGDQRYGWIVIVVDLGDVLAWSGAHDTAGTLHQQQPVERDRRGEEKRVEDRGIEPLAHKRRCADHQHPLSSARPVQAVHCRTPGRGWHPRRVPVRNRETVSFGRHHGVTVLTCQPADPASKGGVEASVKLAKADLVPTDTNLRLRSGVECVREGLPHHHQP